MKQGRRGTPALPHRPAFPPSAPPEYVEGGTPKEKRPFLFQNAFPPAKNKMQGAFFLSGLPPYSAACGGGSAQSERTVQVQAITRSARAKWVRAWVRISSQKETSSEVSSERKPARSGFACILPRSTAAYSDGGGILKCMDLLSILGFVPTLRTKSEISCKSSDEPKTMACFVSRTHSRRGSTQFFLPRSKSFFLSCKAASERMRASLRLR